MLGIEKAKINKIKVVLKRPLVMWFSLNSSQLYQYMLMTFIQGGIPRRQNGLHPRNHPAGFEAIHHPATGGAVSPRKMGRGRMVQGVQTTDGGGRLPWTKRAGSATETLCRLPPERHDPAVLRSRRPSMERKPARTWQAAQADPFQARTGDGGVDIESLLLKQASALQETVTQVVRDIIRFRQQLRPIRSFERRSRKPVKMW